MQGIQGHLWIAIVIMQGIQEDLWITTVIIQRIQFLYRDTIG